MTSPRLSIVIPAFGEVSAIATTMGRVRDELGEIADDGGLEIVVVDDGSADGTADAAAAAGADQVIAFETNKGKGAAVRAGMLAARGRTRAFTDADLSYSPTQVGGLLTVVEAGCDVVVGNRHHERSTALVSAGAVRRFGGRAINLATRAVLSRTYQDTQCGLKAFRGDVAEVLFGHSHIDGFAFDVELLHLVERYGLSIEEVPVEVVNTDTSTVRVVRDALGLLVDLGRIRRHDAQGRYDLTEDQLSMLSSGPVIPGE
jgi:dolichyl-phosphate beta-glucosyltransferase